MAAIVGMFIVVMFTFALFSDANDPDASWSDLRRGWIAFLIVGEVACVAFAVLLYRHLRHGRRALIKHPVEGWNPVPGDPNTLAWWDGSHWTNRAMRTGDRWEVTPLGSSTENCRQRRPLVIWVWALWAMSLVNFITAWWAQNYHPGGPACIGEDWQGSLRPYGAAVWLACWVALVAIYQIGPWMYDRQGLAFDRTARALIWLGRFAVATPPVWWFFIAFGNGVGCGGI